MSVSLVVWLSLFVVLTLLALRRPAWAVALYMLTFFACPPFWWWGKPIAAIRWNFYAGFVLLGAVLLACLVRAKPASITRGGQWVVGLAFAMLANATLVHLLLAPKLAVSSVTYILMAKFVVLFVLIIAAVRDRCDLRVVLFSMIAGAAYIGYEATINDRAKVKSNRLEGIGAAGVQNANELASLIVIVLPLTVPYLFAGNKLDRVAVILAAPLILNVLLLCNSRGGFLAGIVSGAVLLLLSPAKARRQAAWALALGSVVLWGLLGDDRIVDRFMTTFNGEEQRDQSAAGRLVYWGAGLEMISDHPFGAGGDGFRRIYSSQYLARRGLQYEARSVHNGYINDACDWGLQGLLLRIALIGGTGLLLLDSSRRAAANGDHVLSLIGASLLAAQAGHLVTSVFGDHLDREWGYWIAAVAVAVARITNTPPAKTETNGNCLVADFQEEVDDLRPVHSAPVMF